MWCNISHRNCDPALISKKNHNVSILRKKPQILHSLSLRTKLGKHQRLGKSHQYVINFCFLHLLSLFNDFATFSAIFCLEMDVPNRTKLTAVDRYDWFFIFHYVFSPVQVLNAILLEVCCFFCLLVNVLFNLIFSGMLWCLFIKWKMLCECFCKIVIGECKMAAIVTTTYTLLVLF